MRNADLVDIYWENWIALCPAAPDLLHRLQAEGEKPKNDHIALRTVSIEGVNVMDLAQPFLRNGYAAKGTYEFKDKKLDAIHFEGQTSDEPKVFISALRLKECSSATQQILRECVKNIPIHLRNNETLGYSGKHWDFDKNVYDTLYSESEYAAWFYAFGFRANHFTILVNSLNRYRDLKKLNQFIRDAGYTLNTSGGEIKGSPAHYLEQSSILASQVEIQDRYEKKHLIPGCYFEFALRHKQPNGEYYQGFVATSADKIFESTN